MTNWKYSLNWKCSKPGGKTISLHCVFVLPSQFSGQVQTISHCILFRCSPVNRNLCASCTHITSNDSSVRFQFSHLLITQEKEKTPAGSLKAAGLCSTSENRCTPQLAELWHANQDHPFTFAHLRVQEKGLSRRQNFDTISVQIATVL